MTNSLLKLIKEDHEKIATNYDGGDHPFTYQELDEQNVSDAIEWLDNDKMVAIVSEIHGGIIGYVHQSHADDITSVLNLHAIEKLK